MNWERIRKHPEDCVGANLVDYEEYASTFSWAQARALLDGLPGGGLNIAHEAVDRHVLAGRGGRLALRWIGRDNRICDFSYAALRAATDEPLCQYLDAARDNKGRPGVLSPRAQSGTLHRRTRHAEERLRLLALVLGVRIGTRSKPAWRQLGWLELSDREGPFAAINRCTVDPAKADKRTRRKDCDPLTTI